MKRSLEDRLKKRALALGFDACGITSAETSPEDIAALEAFIAAGCHGTMKWMAATLPRRRDPKALMPEAKSAVVCAMSYAPPPELDPLRRARDAELGNISVYALSRDYHDVVKGRLKHLAQWLAARTGENVKVFVDTAPLLERALAVRAGLGWRGKHTGVLSRRLGNWFFIGVILSAAELTPDETARSRCGSCRRCLDICPTGAFLGPGRLDARRCISYLTIEHAGPIARELRPLMGNRVFGCDDCLAVCPWNKFAKEAREERLRAREHLRHTPLRSLLALDEARWRKMFAKTPVRRAGYARFMANVLIAIGNTKSVPAEKVLARLDDPEPLIRAMAVWASSRLLPRPAFLRLREEHLKSERDPMVRAEWLAEA